MVHSTIYLIPKLTLDSLIRDFACQGTPAKMVRLVPKMIGPRYVQSGNMFIRIEDGEGVASKEKTVWIRGRQEGHGESMLIPLLVSETENDAGAIQKIQEAFYQALLPYEWTLVDTEEILGDIYSTRDVTEIEYFTSQTDEGSYTLAFVTTT